MSLFRYPGGKSRLQKSIVKVLKKIASNKIVEYREPFFGGGSIGIKFVNEGNCSKLWINDIDPGIWCIWQSVLYFPDELKKRIQSQDRREICPVLFYKLKNKLLKQKLLKSKGWIARCAFQKLLLHQMSYSGLGTKAGGPMGGKTQQSSAYKIDCRWSPDRMCRKIDKLHKILASRRTKCTCEGFEALFEDNDKAVIMYLDPPYYNKGGELYQFAFQNEQHERLAELLKTSKHEWVLSYDACNEIRRLYDWANIEEFDVKYTIKANTLVSDQDGNYKRRANIKNELLITPAKYKGKVKFLEID